jgi:uncharacterized small protein (DUF1192 family)
MIEEDGPRPRAHQRFVPPPSLEGWDVDALRAYVEALRAEIARAESAIARQEGHRSAADALFRKP